MPNGEVKENANISIKGTGRKGKNKIDRLKKLNPVEKNKETKENQGTDQFRLTASLKNRIKSKK